MESRPVYFEINLLIELFLWLSAERYQLIYILIKIYVRIAKGIIERRPQGLFLWHKCHKKSVHENCVQGHFLWHKCHKKWVHENRTQKQDSLEASRKFHFHRPSEGHFSLQGTSTLKEEVGSEFPLGCNTSISLQGTCTLKGIDPVQHFRFFLLVKKNSNALYRVRYCILEGKFWYVIATERRGRQDNDLEPRGTLTSK